MAEAAKQARSSASGSSSGAKKKSGTGKKAEKKPPEVQGEPVLSGRMVIALALALAMIVIPTSHLRKYITKTAPETALRAAWRVGQKATLHLTVVSSDYDDLACSSSQKVGDAHCEWQDERERFPLAEGAPVDDNKLHTLQPYRTTDSNLLLVPGLWAQPEIAMRVHNEPSRGTTKTKLARFVVSCEVEFLEEWGQAVVRWTPSERWSNQGKAMVGKIHSCTILEDQKS